MYEHSIELRVRYGETDKMGYLYYGNYAEYFEVARVEAIRNLGFSYKDMEDEKGVLLPVTEYHSKFLRAVYYDEVVTIKSTIRETPDRFITFHSEVFNEAGKLANKSEVKLVFVDIKTRKSISCPDFILDALNPYFEVEA